jgi:hypothetical protein
MLIMRETWSALLLSVVCSAACGEQFVTGHAPEPAGAGGATATASSGSSSSTAGQGGAATGAGSGGLGGALAGAGGGAQGGSAAGLDDGELFARYWIDEAASGTLPVELLDAASDPQHLDIDYAGAMVWTEPSVGRRGLLFPDQVTAAVASAPEVTTTKFADLYGRTSLTVEAVATLSGSPTSEARVFHLGDASSWGTILLAQQNPGGLLTGIHDTAGPRWTVQYQQRIVIHVVVDTSAIQAEDRVRAFVDGQLVAPSGGTAPAQNSAFAMEADPAPDAFMIGNRNALDRGWQGVIHYLALYTTVFDQGRISDHAAWLATRDDAP